MPYIDGFVIAVPTANRQKFIDYADKFDPILMTKRLSAHGYLRVEQVSEFWRPTSADRE